jgi:hypothetical protein
MSTYFLVLRSDPTNEQELEEMGLTIESLVMVFGTPFVGKGDNRLSDTIVEHHWQEKRPEAAATVVIVDDLEMMARYLYVKSSDPEHEGRVWKNLKFLLPVVPAEELKDEVRDPGADSAALPRLALGLDTSVFDEDSFQLITEKLGSKDFEMRMDAALAALILKWKRFVVPLKECLSKEDDDNGKAALRHTIDVLETRGTDV